MTIPQMMFLMFFSIFPPLEVCERNYRTSDLWYWESLTPEAHSRWYLWWYLLQVQRYVHDPKQETWVYHCASKALEYRERCIINEATVHGWPAPVPVHHMRMMSSN
jgi:hypothetical protein